MNRNLDGVYFRVKRDEKWGNVCFSDLEEHEMDTVLEGKSLEWVVSLAKILGKRIKEIGDELDIVCDD